MQRDIWHVLYHAMVKNIGMLRRRLQSMSDQQKHMDCLIVEVVKEYSDVQTQVGQLIFARENRREDLSGRTMGQPSSGQANGKVYL